MWFVNDDASVLLGALGNATIEESHRQFLDRATNMEKQQIFWQVRATTTAELVCKL
jgi:hypothetical protein